MQGMALRVLRRGDLTTRDTRVRNWSQIMRYLASFALHPDHTLHEAEGEKQGLRPH